jgi:hypothetical protein
MITVVMENGKNVMEDQHRIISYLEDKMGVRAPKSLASKLNGEVTKNHVLLDKYFRFSPDNHSP